jgi:DNA repair protein SbcC/Rad50
MLLNRLMVRDFRGISGTIDLRCDLPLTVIYAPNGTGKTSICDAIEWLVTGRVGRLDHLPNQALQCGNASSRQPGVVEGVFGWPENGSYRRVIDSSNSHLYTLEDSSWKSLALYGTLPIFAPNIDGTPGKEVNRLRTSWIRASRFFTPRSVPTLLDTDDEEREERRIYFSDLLGIGDYARDRRSLEKIVRRMRTVAGLSSEILTLSTDIQGLQRTIASAARDASAHFREAAAERFRTLSDEVGLESSQHDLQTAIEILRSTVRERQVARVQQANDSELIEGMLSEYPRLLEERLDAADRLSAATQMTGPTEARILDVEEQLRSLKRQAEQLAEQTNELSGIGSQAQQLSIDANRALADAVSHGLQLDDASTRTNIETEIRELEEEEVSLSKTVSSLELLSEDAREWNSLTVMRSAAEEQAAFVQRQLASLQSVAGVRHEELLTRVSSIQAELDATLGVLTRLRAEALDWTSRQETASTCPICEHDYETPARLLQALTSALSAVPASSLALRDELRTLQDELLVTEQREQEAIGLNARAAELAEVIQQFENTRSSAQRSLAAIGFPETWVTAADGFNRVTVALTDTRAQLVFVQSKLRNAREALHIIDIVTGLEGHIHSLITGAARVGSSGIRMASVTSPRDWPELFAQLQQSLGEHRDFLTSELNKVFARERTMALEMQRAREGHSALVSRIEMLTTVAHRVAERLQAFDMAWERLGGMKPVDVDQWAEILGTIAMDKTRDEHIIRRLTEIDALLHEASEAEKREQENLDQQRGLLALQQKLIDLKRQVLIRRDLEIAIGQLAAVEAQVISDQLLALKSTINALYLRGQSNPFLSEISAVVEETMINWVGLAGPITLPDPALFSQGQRQDLALAIYLARARSLRGTFVLDEPLHHLDDLNRLAMLDVLRVLISERHHVPIRIIVTTASESLIRHIRAKFSLLPANESEAAVRIYRVSGNALSGVEAIEEEIPFLRIAV